MARPHLTSRYLDTFALALSAIGLLLGAGISYAGGPCSGNTCYFSYCGADGGITAILPNGRLIGPGCVDVGPYTLAKGRDALGEFDSEHSDQCRKHGKDCAPAGPGIAATTQGTVSGDVYQLGYKPGWYHIKPGTHVLTREKNLKACIAASKLELNGVEAECFCVGPNCDNREQGS